MAQIITILLDVFYKIVIKKELTMLMMVASFRKIAYGVLPSFAKSFCTVLNLVGFAIQL